MKAIGRIWNGTSLIVKILIGLALGILFGLLTPQAAFICILGNLFVGALKGIAPLLVFVLVISSLANATGGIGKRFSTVIVLYLVSTLVAAVIAVVSSFLFPITIKLTTGDINTVPPGELKDIFLSILDNIVQNPISAIAEANYIGVLAWAIMLGSRSRPSLPRPSSPPCRTSPTLCRGLSAGSSAWRPSAFSAWCFHPFPPAGCPFSRITAGCCSCSWERWPSWRWSAIPSSWA